MTDHSAALTKIDPAVFQQPATCKVYILPARSAWQVAYPFV